MTTENTKMNSPIIPCFNDSMVTGQESALKVTKEKVSITLSGESLIPMQNFDSSQTTGGDDLTNQCYLSEITAKIIHHKEKVEQSFIEIGKLLIEAKKELPHGHWLPWLQSNVEMSAVMAQRLMRIAEAFSNTSPVTHLGFTKAFILVSLPSDERDAFIAETHEINGVEKRVGDMSKRELQDIVREHKQIKKINLTPKSEEFYEHQPIAKKYLSINANKKSEMYSIQRGGTLSKTHDEGILLDLAEIQKYIDNLLNDLSEVKDLDEYNEIVTVLESLSMKILESVTSANQDAS